MYMTIPVCTMQYSYAYNLVPGLNNCLAVFLVFTRAFWFLDNSDGAKKKMRKQTPLTKPYTPMTEKGMYRRDSPACAVSSDVMTSDDALLCRCTGANSGCSSINTDCLVADVTLSEEFLGARKF